MARIRMLITAAACAAAFGSAVAAPTVESEARTSGKGVMILQVGSDWCVSGEFVRKAFESPEFKRAFGSKYVLAVHDEIDDAANETDAIKASNAAVKSMLIRSDRFPAITCYAGGGDGPRVFAQIENIPIAVDGERLARAVGKIVAKKDRVEELFKSAAAAKDEAAANLYGEGFDILLSMMGQFYMRKYFNEITTGKFGWEKEWNELKALDKYGKLGWIKHFELDDYKGIAMVQDVTEARKKDGNAAAKVKAVTEIPQDHFTPNQKQWVKIMQFALTQNGSDKQLSKSERQLLEEALAIDRSTFWGQFAAGRLMMDGASVAPSAGLPKAKVRARPPEGNSVSGMAYKIDAAKSALAGLRPDGTLNDAQKLAVARYAVLRLIGEQGWQKLVSRPGSAQFVKAFMNDRVWMEDFAWSGSFPENSTSNDCPAGNGPGAGANAILALESLIYQDEGRWCKFKDGKYADNEGRRFMTALAIVFPDRDEAWLADVLDAYRTTAKSGRLHKSAYKQPVWLWRFAVHQGHYSGGCDNMAAQHRHMDKFCNIPAKELGGAQYRNGIGLEYRMNNCFGDSVHGPYYYKAWEKAGEWPKRKYSQIVGGVCGELSKFGSAISNAHGMPSTTAGEPGHCAYTRRLPNGKWSIDNMVVPQRQWKVENNKTEFTNMHMCFWNKHAWQYSAVLDRMFTGDRETRLSADRLIELAHFAEERGSGATVVEGFYRKACNSWPNNYNAWLEFGGWIARSNAPIDKMRLWLKGYATGLKKTDQTGRQPLWDLLTPFFERVAKEQGAKALADELIAFAPYLRQRGDKIVEEADFGVVLERWCKPLGSDSQARYNVLKAMLEAQYGTNDYFSYMLGWGSDYFMKLGEGGVKTFIKCLGEALAAKSKESGGKSEVDFSPLLLSASQSDNLAAFRLIADLQNKLSPLPKGGDPYPKNDFGGELLSSGGLLKTSSTCNWDTPSRYAYVIDDTPCGGNGFHTEKEKAPWAQVMLAGPTSVRGLVVENRSGGYNASRQVPLYVDVSDDGTSWRRVKTINDVASTFRIDLRQDSPSARYVRVGRVAGAKEEVYHLNKILVYGTKLY
ncbi:MAG: discoidin domain-containing protein [Kiritimatiellae bacterium]|nr:discoidin domain-containing protein [Kiritimatiellia bacterium]